MENSNVEYDYKGVFIDGDNSIVGFGGMTYDEKYLEIGRASCRERV